MPLQHWTSANQTEFRASAEPVSRSCAGHVQRPGRLRVNGRSAHHPFQTRVGEGCGSMCGRNVVFSVPQSGHLQLGGMAANGVPLGMA
jgi:hypothetical protein